MVNLQSQIREFADKKTAYNEGHLYNDKIRGHPKFAKQRFHIFGKKHTHVRARTNDENGCPAKLGMSDGFLLADTDALLSSF
jgi:hypothetical protein